MQFKKTTVALSVGGLLACGGVAGWLAPTLLGANRADAADASATASAPPAAIAAPVPLGQAPNYRAIVAENRAAVVGVNVEGEVQTSARGAQPFEDSPFGEDDPFFKFFRDIPVPKGNAPTHGLGSGFIVRSDGIILTNAHVVRDAQHVTVKLADHREYRAKVLGLDAATDVAVLKIDAHDLPVVRLANSDQLAVGDYVLAIGAPYGLEETATAGIVSAKGRSLPGNSYVPFIQTDVAVNPGNSGGPLFDAHGEVVGINSQIYSSTGGFQGVSFAIPIDVAARDEQQILKSGKVEHAKLGVMVQPIDQSLASSFKLSNPAGALVSKVDPGSAAARAGIEPGDVILKCNGQAVVDAGSLSYAIGMLQPGSEVKLDVWRQGKAMTLTAKLDNASREAGLTASASSGEHAKLGLTLRPLTRDERTQAGVSSGLVVEDASGPAASAGIQPGDVVLSADGAPVDSIEQLRDIVSKHKDVVALLIQRGDSRIFVPVQLG
jgi:serine protease Do